MSPQPTVREHWTVAPGYRLVRHHFPEAGTTSASTAAAAAACSTPEKGSKRWDWYKVMHFGKDCFGSMENVGRCLLRCLLILWSMDKLGRSSGMFTWNEWEVLSIKSIFSQDLTVYLESDSRRHKVLAKSTSQSINFPPSSRSIHYRASPLQRTSEESSPSWNTA